jgi:hypothetical protein
MKKNIILVSYKNNVDWIVQNRDIFNEVHLIIKDGSDQSHLKEHSIQTYNYRNIGNEYYGYLNWIVSNYDNIDPDDCYIFSQANPFDHNANFLDEIKSIDKNSNFPIPLSKLRLIETLENVFFPPQSAGFPRRFCIGSYLNRFFYVEDMPYNLHYMNGMWAVTGEQILNRKLKFYEECVGTIGEFVHPIESHVFERLFNYIFDPKYLDWISNYDQIRSKFLGGHYYGTPMQ